MSEETLIPTNFTVITDFLTTEYTVFVLGNCKELGNWDSAKSVELKRKVLQNNQRLIWNVTIHLPQMIEIEYKYIIKENDFLSCWETFPENRKLVVSKNFEEKEKEKEKGNEKEKGKEKEKEQEKEKQQDLNGISKFGKYQKNYRNKWVDCNLLVDEMLIILQMDLVGDEIIPGITLDEEVIPEAALKNTKKQNRSQFFVTISKRKSIKNKKKTQNEIEKERKQDLLKWDSYSVVDTEIYRYKCPVNNKATFDLKIVYKDHEMIGSTTLTNNSIKNNSGHVVLPLFDTKHELVGEVTFRYYKILPFLGKRKRHNNLSNIFRTYWSPKEDQIYIGHRGSGSNKGWSRVQENSILSFQLAQNSKVSDWIEFDVQITKDQKIVVYHDFYVTIQQETNILKIPICKMTEKEFFSHRNGCLRNEREKIYQKKLNKIKKSQYLNIQKKKKAQKQNKTPNIKRNTKTNSQGAERKQKRSNKAQKNGTLKKISYIKSKSSTDITTLLLEKPKEIKKKKKKKKENLLKKNLKSQKNLITDRFINLDHIFQQLNDDLNFNIEIKYPYTFTCEKELNYPDRNVVVDKTLEIVLKYSKGKTRKRIIFSSFDPIICLMVNWKQPKFPVFFLNDGGNKLFENPLMNSLEHALHFSSKSKFKGIVCHTEALLTNKNFVQRVHNHNLVLFTYGEHNNDKNYLQIQKKLKVDGIIGDKVSKINLKSINK
ncbi:glycerophosphoryl diester phosphodiesterase [Anaeramoeba flamelloides]|uniref:Glycerophosphoryl diester phosphodiesterase n=1 Tax=Anaeramoeba flamelloides TaxID=1746091 RepID=A0ABQ8X1T0_9EUKA|nr:glycerophosphoryl diester phosphodiesterase [Anaeramoeba flamelloides]